MRVALWLLAICQAAGRVRTQGSYYAAPNPYWSVLIKRPHPEGIGFSHLVSLCRLNVLFHFEHTKLACRSKSSSFLASLCSSEKLLHIVSGMNPVISLIAAESLPLHVAVALSNIVVQTLARLQRRAARETGSIPPTSGTQAALFRSRRDEFQPSLQLNAPLLVSRPDIADLDVQRPPTR